MDSSTTTGPVRVFISYRHADHRILDELRDHLGWLENSDKIQVFDDREILGGDDWDARIRAELERAEIILLVVTARFMHSPYCTKLELKDALKRRDREGTRIIPIIAETCDWEAMPIFRIAALPKDKANNLKPLNKWRSDRDVALTQVAQHVRHCTDKLEKSREATAGQAAVKNAARAASHLFSADTNELTTALSKHIFFLKKWTAQVQMLEMSQHVSTDKATISLSISSMPRRFRAPDADLSLSEDDLLISGNHFILLGDPGSGKTTTIKRLTRKLLPNATKKASNRPGSPFVVLGRELEGTETLIEHAARKLGFKLRDFYELKSGQKEEEYAEKRRFFYEDRKNQLEDHLIRLLDKMATVFIIDGIDEFPPVLRRDLELTLRTLSLSVKRSKIIATCRSGDFARQIEGFRVVEIAPLDHGQMRSIVDRWANEPNIFVESISKTPYYDMATKPLFLCQLILLYNAARYVPPRPVDIYRRITLLALERWDEHRGIQRRTRYANFFPDRKYEFLSSMAFELLVTEHKKVFTSEHLLFVYGRIHSNFSLPPNEAEQIVSEIKATLV
jgi:hypothetical protein